MRRRQFTSQALLAAAATATGSHLSLTASTDTPPLQHIVFGSCLDTHEHPMLDQTLTLPRDLFIFMGDNIYADKGGLPMMREKYALLKNSPFFKGLRSRGSILATWDDHDFGQNDGGADYGQRREAQHEFYDWLEEPADSPRRSQPGVYHAQTFGPEGRRVQVLMLDTRYFRSPLQKRPKDQRLLGGAYGATTDTSTTMLGEAQWQWLEQQLLQPAELRLLVSSIQVVPDLHGGECWANLPHEQARLYQLLSRTRANGVVILSGDRHWCEFSRLEKGPLPYPLYDFTASSMTQKHPRGTPTPNQTRFLNQTYHLPSVGHLTIDWAASSPQLHFKIMDASGQTQLQHTLHLADLSPA